jgi:hypothetical protein
MNNNDNDNDNDNNDNDNNNNSASSDDSYCESITGKAEHDQNPNQVCNC